MGGHGPTLNATERIDVSRDFWGFSELFLDIYTSVYKSGPFEIYGTCAGPNTAGHTHFQKW